jgi:ATP-binding cassette subfamily B protein
MQRADRLLVSTLSRFRRGLTVLVFLALLDIAVTLALPAALGFAVDAVLDGQGIEPVVLFAGLILLSSGVDYAFGVVQGTVLAAGAADLRNRMVRHLLRRNLPLAEPPGEVLSRVLTSAGDAAGFPRVVISLGASVLTGVGAVIALGVIDGWLVLVWIAGMPVIVLVARRFVGQMGVIAMRYQSAQARISARFTDALVGARTIRASGTAGTEADRILTPLPELRRAGHAFWLAQRDAVWRMGLLAPTLQIGVLTVAGFGVARGTVSPGEMLAAVGYLAPALGLVRQVMALGEVGHVRGSAERVAEFLAAAVARPRTGRPAAGPGALALRDVSVTRDNRQILDRVSLEVPAGVTLALVGRSGTGKSMIAQVAGGLLLPDSGTVRLDGQLIETLAPGSVASFAFDRPGLLGETVADAIGYADGTVSREAVEEAARRCRADDFVRRLPAGYDTPLADLRLSGGEVQRLGLARAACRDTPMVILDDALSNLDIATEAWIADALTDAQAGRTRLIVAHRAATARRADLVAWLDAGRIKAVAPHRELWDDPDYRAAFGTAPADEDHVLSHAVEEGIR